MSVFFVTVLTLFCGDFEGQAKQLCIDEIIPCQMHDDEGLQFVCAERKYSEWFLPLAEKQ